MKGFHSHEVFEVSTNRHSNVYLYNRDLTKINSLSLSSTTVSGFVRSLLMKLSWRVERRDAPPIKRAKS